jgi:hypothetical protein
MKLPAARPAAVSIPSPRRAKDSEVASAAAAPSSLIKVPDSTRVRCVACGSPKLMQIAMTLTDGTPVQFTSCRHCEHRHWTNEGEVLAVDSVLAKATKQRA